MESKEAAKRNLKPLGQSQTTVVIGGGNTAIDSVTQAKRIGTKRVIMAYRRGPEEMGAYDFEYELAKQDEIEFLWNTAPIGITGKSKVEGIQFQQTKSIGGRLVTLPGSNFDLPCDRVIKAIGQTKQKTIAKTLGLSLGQDGRLCVDPKTLQTSHPRVFAGGDAINGGKEVVNAAADGKRAAWAMHRHLIAKASPPVGQEYWVSTIEGRQVAPIPPRGGPVHKKIKNKTFAAAGVSHG
jgi:glutamate synthase (NADPH/NADH) small chain